MCLCSEDVLSWEYKQETELASYLALLYLCGENDRANFTMKFGDHTVATNPTVIVSNMSTVLTAQPAYLSVFGTLVSLVMNTPVPPVST